MIIINKQIGNIFEMRNLFVHDICTEYVIKYQWIYVLLYDLRSGRGIIKIGNGEITRIYVAMV